MRHQHRFAMTRHSGVSFTRVRAVPRPSGRNPRVRPCCVPMTLFTRTSAAVAELEAAFAAASADPAPPSKAVADGWASSLAALAPSVAKMRATALESDPEKQLYAPAMRDKVLDLVARLEAAQAAFAPLQARPARARRRGAEGTTLLQRAPWLAC